MVDEILNAAGIQHKETRFMKPPAGTYAVWFDGFTTEGADLSNNLFLHDVYIELYSQQADKEAETRIEAELNRLKIAFEKQDRQWLDNEKLYLVGYGFTFYEKRR